MSDADEDRFHLDEISKWDPDFTRRVFGFLRPVMKRYFRAEVRGADHIPRGRRRAAGVESLRRPILP